MKTTKKLTLLLTLALLIIASILVLSSCNSNDNQSISNTPKTCNHQWIEATCTEPKTCSLCQEVKGIANGHTEVVDLAVTPTCTQTGLTEGKHCSVCDKILTSQTVIPASKHDWGNPTCVTPMSCCVCFEVDPNSEPIGHRFVQGACVICGEYDPDYIAYGRVYGQLTYQYNKFVGTRGDNGATVMLIPYNNEVKNYDNHKAAMLLSGTYDSGIIVKECDGYGNFDFGNSVPVGKYILVAISDNTTSAQRFDDEEFWKFLIDGSFGNLFSDDDRETLYTFVGFSDWTFEILTIEEGDSINFTHDYGYTYI